MAANEYFACLAPNDASKKPKSCPRGDIRGTQKSTPTVPLSRVVDCSFLHYIAWKEMVRSPFSLSPEITLPTCQNASINAMAPFVFNFLPNYNRGFIGCLSQSFIVGQTGGCK